ncbi:hypothetical protein [Pseudorhodoferax sp.]|uniref:hypothetical protein n=1 Tax=Pseudorhodoferax sp. TaxID=1993553 RepID=UPI0039E3B80C
MTPGNNQHHGWSRVRGVLRALGIAGLLALLCAGCTSVAPYRTIVQEAPLAPDEAECARYDPAADGSLRRVELRAQRRTERLDCYAYAIESTDQYKLFFVEFDEQGRFYDRAQMTRLERYLQHMRQRGRAVARSGKPAEDCSDGGGGLSIVTFVHGWRHNARHDDGNVQLARQVLRYTYAGEQARPQYNPARCPRQVVGIYVGWRGLSTTATDAADSALLRTLLAPWELLSVWDRKNTAQNVAVGSVRELFGTVRAYQELRNDEEGAACGSAAEAGAPAAGGAGRASARPAAAKPGPATGKGKDNAAPNSLGVSESVLGTVYQCLAVRHLIVGHSFGALIVHNAVAQQLVENVASGRFVDPDEEGCRPGPSARQGGRALVRGYADLIVLLNPAVEGARYEPLHEAVMRRGQIRNPRTGAFCRNQKPVMVVLTSEHDLATRQAFYAVRALNTVFENNRPYSPQLSAEMRDYVAQEESRSSLRTMGHDPRYTTHVVVGWDKFLQQQAAGHAPGAQPAGTSRGEPARSSQAQARFDEMRKADQEAAAAHAALADEIRRRCASGATPSAEDQLFCADAAARSTASSVPPQDLFEACMAAALVDENLARVLQPDGQGSEGRGVAGWGALFAGGAVLSHLPYYLPDYNLDAHEVLVGNGDLPEYHSPYSPVWNVIVRDASIIDGHNDVDGDSLVRLIAQLYRSVVLSSFDPAVLQKLPAIAGQERQHCATLRTAAQHGPAL